MTAGILPLNGSMSDFELVTLASQGDRTAFKLLYQRYYQGIYALSLRLYGHSGLDKLIFKLPERARMVFVLCAIEGYQHDEIADLLGIAVGTSKSQYHSAKAGGNTDLPSFTSESNR